MGIGGIDAVRVMDDVLRHADSVRAAFVEASKVHDPLFFGGTRGGISRTLAISRANGQAAEAERLLAPIAAAEPALEPLLDALRGARALQQSLRPDRTAVVQVASNLEREGWAGRAWQQVQPLDREARIRELGRLRELGPKAMTQDDYRTLAGIVGDDVQLDITADIPRSLGDALSLRDLSLRVAETGTYENRKSYYFVGHEYFDAWSAAQQAPDARRARIAELFTGDPAARTKEEWRELAGLLRAGGHDRVEHPWFPGRQLDRAVRGAQIGGYERASSHRPLIEGANDTARARVRDQLLAPGDLDELAADVVRRGKLDLVGITGSDASRVRLRHLTPTNPKQAGEWLGDVRDALERATVDGPTRDLRESAYRLIDRNLDRVNGERGWWRVRDGYANHPDYAELGRIRSTYQLLEQVGSIDARSVRSTPASDAAGLISW